MSHTLTKPPGSWIFGSLLLAAFAGCAYYNTFYLAKRYYREGQRAQERSVTDAPAPDAIAKYDATIRQCAKILVDYPKSKWVDDAIYFMGAAMYGKGDYSGAIKKFEELRANTPNSPYVPDSKLTEALARLKRKEYAEAEALFFEVDKQYPSLPRRWELCFYAGECEAQLQDYPLAVSWYERADQAAKNRRERADALRRMGDALLECARFEEAQAVYAQCLKEEERGRKRLDVALSRGGVLQELKRYDEALAFYSTWRLYAVQDRRDGEFAIRIFECMGQLGRVKEALAGYQGLVEKFPHSSVAYEAQFRIGYLLESQVGDLDAAGREYEKLKNEPQSQFQSQAVRRAQNLATLKQYRQAMLADTTQAKARAAFMLAELYYFQLEKTDSALIQYRTVEREFPGSPYAPKAAFALLWIHTHDQSDTAAVAALTDSIVTRYRKTRYAESALYLWKQWSGRTDERTALFDSMLANPDTTVMRERLTEKELLEHSAALAQAKDSLAMSQKRDSLAAIPPTPRQQPAPAELARLDSLRYVTRNSARALRGLPPLPRPAQFGVSDSTASRPAPSVPDSTAFTPAPAETTRAQDAPPLPPPDSTSAPVIGPSR